MIAFPLPPGLTCLHCKQPFAGELARRSPDGWRHTRRCAEACTVADCTAPRAGQGYCNKHYRRWQRHGDPLALARPPIPPLCIEDVEWMVETGEHIEGAARRLGRSVETLERALERAGRRDLYVALKRRVLVAA